MTRPRPIQLWFYLFAAIWMTFTFVGRVYADTGGGVAIPSWDQIANLGPSGILAIGFWLLATGKLTPGTLLTRAEARTDAAIATAKATADAQSVGNEAFKAFVTQTDKWQADMLANLVKLTEDHAVERREFAQEIAAMGRRAGGAKA